MQKMSKPKKTRRLERPPKKRRHSSERSTNCMAIFCSQKANPTEALVRLNKANDIDEAFIADVEFQSGKPEAALKRLQDWVGRSRNQVRPLAALIEMQYRQQKKDEAKQTFETLREISGAIELEVATLRAVANRSANVNSGYGTDWRKAETDRTKRGRTAGTVHAGTIDLAASAGVRLVVARRR